MALPTFIGNESEFTLDALSDDAMQGLMAMKYDADDPLATALNYKEEGNLFFGKQQYDLAVDNYTAGINAKCEDKEVESQLYFNRGMANFKRQNYRTALRDFHQASQLKVPYIKAVLKAAECCLHLNRFDDCLKCCEVGLSIEPDNRFILATRDQCLRKKIENQIAEQKREAALKRAQVEKDALMTSLKSHGVRFHPSTSFTMEWFQGHCPRSCIPNFADSKDKSALCWPLVLSYPELKMQDFIESFNETLLISDLLQLVFGEEREDLDPTYKPDVLDIFFEDSAKGKLIQINPQATFLATLRRPGFVVCDGTPSFIVLCKKRKEFNDEFIKNYDSVDLL